MMQQKLSADAQPLVLIGGGGHAQVLASFLWGMPEWNLLGYIDQQAMPGMFDVPWLGNDAAFRAAYPASHTALALGIGSKESGHRREDIVMPFLNAGYDFPPLVAPHAFVSPWVRLGKGAQIMVGALMTGDANVGDFCIMNTQVSFEHGAVAGNFCHLSASVAVGGDTHIGPYSMIGIGSTLNSQINICDHVHTGAGAVVTKDITAPGLYVGVPARKVR